MTLRYQHLSKAVDAACGNSKKHKPLRIMEIGVFDAVHGRQMVERATKNGRALVEYYGFDLFEDMTPAVNEAEIGKKTLARSYDQTMAYLKAKSKAKVIKLFKGDTKVTLPNAVESLPKMDVIFIDGGHSLGTVQSDFEHAIKLAHQKTIVLLDDYYPNDMTKGCAFLVESDLKQRQGMHVEVLEPLDVYSESGISVKFVKVTFVQVPEAQTPQSYPEVSVAEEVNNAVATAEVPAEAGTFRSENSDNNTDIQPSGVRVESCGNSSCEYTGQPCNGGGRCESRVEGGYLDQVSPEPTDTTPVPEERQELDAKLELGTEQSPGTENTDSGADEQRRDVPKELEQLSDESTPRTSRRSRRSRNKRSRSQTETTDSQDNEGLQDNG